MPTRRSPYRDVRDGTWVPVGAQAVIPPRRLMERLREDYWRMTASYVETW